MPQPCRVPPLLAGLEPVGVAVLADFREAQRADRLPGCLPAHALSSRSFLNSLRVQRCDGVPITYL